MDKHSSGACRHKVKQVGNLVFHPGIYIFLLGIVLFMSIPTPDYPPPI